MNILIKVVFPCENGFAIEYYVLNFGSTDKGCSVNHTKYMYAD